MDARVRAIREHALVGRGSCTAIDEGCGDEELITLLDFSGVDSPEEAINWAIHQEDLFIDLLLDTRQGEDDDPQLLLFQEWREAKASHHLKGQKEDY